jgi:hypothetical protein
VPWACHDLHGHWWWEGECVRVGEDGRRDFVGRLDKDLTVVWLEFDLQDFTGELDNGVFVFDWDIVVEGLLKGLGTGMVGGGFNVFGVLWVRRAFLRHRRCFSGSRLGFGRRHRGLGVSVSTLNVLPSLLLFRLHNEPGKNGLLKLSKSCHLFLSHLRGRDKVILIDEALLDRFLLNLLFLHRRTYLLSLFFNRRRFLNNDQVKSLVPHGLQDDIDTGLSVFEVGRGQVIDNYTGVTVRVRKTLLPGLL